MFKLFKQKNNKLAEKRTKIYRMKCIWIINTLIAIQSISISNRIFQELSVLMYLNDRRTRPIKALNDTRHLRLKISINKLTTKKAEHLKLQEVINNRKFLVSKTKMKLRSEKLESFEVLYILGHTNTNPKRFLVFWKGFSRKKDFSTFEPRSSLLPESKEMLNLYENFVKRFGNPLKNPELRAKCKDFIRIPLSGKSRIHKELKPKIARIIVNELTDGLNTRFVKQLFEKMIHNGFYAFEHGIQW